MNVIVPVYLFVLCLATVCCLWRFRQVDLPARIFALFVLVSTFTEVLAHLAAARFQNNMPIYAIYSLMEFGFISLYFNYSIDVFARKRIGYIIGGVGLVFGATNIIFIQGLDKMNSYFMIFEGIAIIGMGLFSFLRLLQKNEAFDMRYYHHFWLTTILVFFWAVTLINWSLYNYFTVKSSGHMNAINAAMLFFNIFIYLGVTGVFLMMPYMQKKYAR